MTANNFRIGQRGAVVVVTVAWSTGEKKAAMASFRNEDIVDELFERFENWCARNPEAATQLPLAHFDGKPV